MKKAVIILLLIVLTFQFVYANPKPENNSIRAVIIISACVVATLVFVYSIYTSFSEHDTIIFAEEQIDISVEEDDSVTVTGIYKFTRTNNAKNNLRIIYPFPEQKRFGEIEVLEVLQNGKAVKYNQFDLKCRNQIDLELYFHNSSEYELKISFIQKPENRNYKYILTTTKTWKRPLEHAIINLQFPENVELKKCNYPLETQESDSKLQLNKNDFYPDKDFIFSWK